MDLEELIEGFVGYVFLMGMAAAGVLGLLIWGIVELVG